MGCKMSEAATLFLNVLWSFVLVIPLFEGEALLKLDHFLNLVADLL